MTRNPLAIAALIALAALTPRLARADAIAAEDASALKQYALTTAAISRSTAFEDRLDAANDPDAVDAFKRVLDGAGTIEESSRALERNPVIAQALLAAHLAARDYLLVILSVAQAMLLVELEKSGQPPSTGGPDQINRANTGFVKTHKSLLRALSKSLDRLRNTPPRAAPSE